MGDNLFLNVEQIIPTKDAEEFVIGLAGKAIEESRMRKRSNDAIAFGANFGAA